MTADSILKTDVQAGLEAIIDWCLSRPELFETILD